MKNMEVHHHPDLHHKEKKFKEYFLEFLMIFLAVTLGFFAESLRENISDHRQVNEYMHAMISELKSDVVMYDANDLLNSNYCNVIDTIFTLINTNTSNGKLYYLARKLTMMGSAGPSINAKTYLQMSSTGAFRLIKHQHIADSIALYYEAIKSFDNWAELQRTRLNNLIALNNKLFNANVFFSIYKAIESKSDSLQQILLSNPPLISKDPNDINAVMMHYQYYYGFMKLMNSRSSVASKQAKELVALLEKEYNINE